MRRFIISLMLLVAVVSQAAVPTFQSFEPTQFETNGLSIKYLDPWTNEVTVIHPATVNTGVVMTNLTDYGTFALPAKVTALALGTNQLDMSVQSTWLLSSPTNAASQVILSLSAGREQGQIAVLSSQNGAESFTLPNASEQYNVPGAFVYLQGIDWIGTTNRGIILQYTAPDWVEMARFGSTGGPIFTNTSGGGDTIWTNIAGVIQPVSGQVTNMLRFTSGQSSSGTNVILLIDTSTTITNDDRFALFRNQGNELFSINYDGSVVSQDLASGNFIAGPFNTLSGTYSAIVGGDSHIMATNINGSIIAGGHASVIDGAFAGIFGGARNVSFGDPASVILGGEDNNITSNTGYSAILAGDTCTINTFPGSDYFTILGGQANKLLGNSGSAKFYANIWGGHDNVGSASSTWIIGNNITNATASTIQMGLSNAKKVVIDVNGDLSISGKTNLLSDDGTRYLRNASPLITFVYPVAVSDETTSLTAGTNKVRFRAPFAFTLTNVRASLTTAQTSGSTLTVFLSESGTTVLSTPVTIDNGSKTSVGAGTPPVISDSSIADDAELSISISTVGDGTATGLKFEIYGYQ